MSKSYEELKSSNPYSKENRPKYTPTFWDKILGAIGLQTGEDRYNMEMDLNEKATNFQLETAQREEEYNSAPEQAQRDWLAGINPNLSGDVNPGQATEITEPAETYKPEASPDEKILESSINLGRMLIGDFTDVMSIFGTLGNDIVDIRGKILGQDEQEIINTWKMIELALYGNNMYPDIPDEALPGEIKPTKKEATPTWYDNLLSSKRNRDKLFATRKHLMGTVLNDIAKGKRGIEKGETGAGLDDRYVKGLTNLHKQIMENSAQKALIEARYNKITDEILQENTNTIKCANLAELEQKINQAKVSGNTAELQTLEKVKAKIDNEMLKKDKEMQEQDLKTIKEYEESIKDIDTYYDERFLGTKGKHERRKYMSAMQRQYGTNYTRSKNSGITASKHGIGFNSSENKTN